MLTTQIGGLMQRIVGSNEESIEETARLLAQATIGEGRIIISGFNEMDAVRLVAMNGAEIFVGAVAYEENMKIGKEDRVWILARSANEKPALELARLLAKEFIPFAAVAAENDDDDNELSTLATTYISTGLLKGLLPGNDGKRYVEPHALAALFIYEAVKIAYDEMLADE